MKTYNKEPTKHLLQEGDTITPEVLASHLAGYMKERHIVTYCAIEDPGRIHKLFCDNLSKLAHLIKGKISPEPEKATKQIGLWANIIFKYFEMWNRFGLSPLYLLEQIKKNTLFSCAFIRLMLAAVDKRDVLDSQPILDLIWARLLRHLDVENDNTFMTLIDEGFSPAELAKVATVCLYDSQAIAFKLSKLKMISYP